MTTETDTLREALSAVGVKRRESKRLRAEAARDLAVLAPRARAAGLKFEEISELADLSRPAIYAILERSR